MRLEGNALPIPSSEIPKKNIIAPVSPAFTNDCFWLNNKIIPMINWQIAIGNTRIFGEAKNLE